ncbi:hypothetical protein ABT56_11450 [Photobacterium aquae]|uniref:Uncharacterized protein n=1 Tax=Photobacterium aquae TaxID=1195763 RepID=A0A0J1H148_9GAMM|nr:hypothetical protein [Photobacterium aquae]KLV05570.1 hypothetical protein ABT56_11450 [Photobacterium aquae]
MVARMTIGRETILNLDSVEYKWIEALCYDGVEEEMINESIQRCLGGDKASADLLRRIALKQCSPNELLRYIDQL